MRSPAILAVALLAPTTLAQTHLFGPDFPAGTYTAAASPYIVHGDLIVQAGTTVTIQHGATFHIFCQDDMQAGSDPNRVEISVYGSLVVQGTAANPVVFSPTDCMARDIWAGIAFLGTGATANASHLTVRGAQIGVSFSLNNNPANFNCTNLTADTCTTGVTVAMATAGMVLPNYTATNNTTGVTSNAPSLVLDNPFLSANQRGFNLNTPGNAALRNATITRNTEWGVRSGSTGAMNVTNSIVAHNTGTGLIRAGAGNLLFTDGLVWGNAASYSNVAPGANIISADPMFASTTSPVLLFGSAAIDAANPFLAPAADLYATARPVDGDYDSFARADLGAVEFTCNARPGYTTMPTPQSVPVGEALTFSATPLASPATLQWRLNGSPIVDGRGVSGATTPTLTVQAAGPWDVGSYTLAMTTTCGTATTPPVSFTLAPSCGSSDFNGDGDVGTDADIEAFFRVLAGGGC